MKTLKREEFLKKGTETLGQIFDTINKLPALELDTLKGDKTALIIVDMINGFAREGALKSPRVEALITEIVEIIEACDDLNIKKVAFADNHTEKSPEFEAYPTHCLTGDTESEVVDEIKKIGGYTLIPKNSTNGFIEERFQEWLKDNRQIDTFIVVGDCTDICVEQFANTLKTWFNKQDKKVRVIVPVNAVDTYDFGLHDGDLMNVMALFFMMGNGIEVVKELKI